MNAVWRRTPYETMAAIKGYLALTCPDPVDEISLGSSVAGRGTGAGLGRIGAINASS